MKAGEHNIYRKEDFDDFWLGPKREDICMRNVSLFKPEEFQHEIDAIPQHSNEGKRLAAETANKKLNEWLNKGTRLYSSANDDWHKVRRNRDTYAAVLVNMEEIDEIPCPHRPTLHRMEGNSEPVFCCYHCGKLIMPQGGWVEYK